MDYLIQWITNIILFILLATIIDMLLPNSSMQKYVKLVISLLLITIILSPIMKILSADFEGALATMDGFQTLQTNQNIENSIEMQKKEIQASQHAYILEQTAVQMKLDAEEELMKQYGMKIVDIEINAAEFSDSFTHEDLQSIRVVIADQEHEDDAVAVVKAVEINTNQPLPAEKDVSTIHHISSLLSEKWDIPKSSIEISVEGGT